MEGIGWFRGYNFPHLIPIEMENIHLAMITNKDLKLCNEQLFSYSAAYQVPFYGREETIQEMQALSEGLEFGQALTISQPLGTWKTQR